MCECVRSADNFCVMYLRFMHGMDKLLQSRFYHAPFLAPPSIPVWKYQCEFYVNFVHNLLLIFFALFCTCARALFLLYFMLSEHTSESGFKLFLSCIISFISKQLKILFSLSLCVCFACKTAREKEIDKTVLSLKITRMQKSLFVRMQFGRVFSPSTVFCRGFFSFQCLW